MIGSEIMTSEATVAVEVGDGNFIEDGIVDFGFAGDGFT